LGATSVGGSYELFGEEQPDCLNDMLQGSIGNCGILAAIDALCYRKPREQICQFLELDGSADCPQVKVRLFDLYNGEPDELCLGGGDIEVIEGTAVPKFARSLSRRAWGVILEQALAIHAGGYEELNQSEPQLAWLAMGGLEVMVTRFSRSPINSVWYVWEPLCLYSRFECVPTTPRTPKAKWRWGRDWRRKPGQAGIKDDAAEALIEEVARECKPVVIYPVGNLQPSTELGEPCVPLQLGFGEVPPSQDEHIPESRFPVGHAYAFRTARREAGNDLWVQLRDPRRVRLLWVRWRDVINAGAGNVVIYVCDWPLQPREQLR